MWFSWCPKKSVALVESADGVHWSEPELWFNGRHGSVEQIGLATHAGEDLGFPKRDAKGE